MKKVSLKPAGGEVTDVQLHRADGRHSENYVVRLGDTQTEIEVETLSNRSGWMRMHGRVAPYYAVRTSGGVQVWIGGRVYDFEILDRSLRRTQSGASAAIEDLTAPMPGTVLKILVEPGESFEPHQPQVIMESMKMEMTLSAPAAGRVKEICCQENELVEMGAILIRLEGMDHDDETA